MGHGGGHRRSRDLPCVRCGELRDGDDPLCGRRMAGAGWTVHAAGDGNSFGLAGWGGRGFGGSRTSGAGEWPNKKGPRFTAAPEKSQKKTNADPTSPRVI